MKNSRRSWPNYVIV